MIKKQWEHGVSSKTSPVITRIVHKAKCGLFYHNDMVIFYWIINWSYAYICVLFFVLIILFCLGLRRLHSCVIINTYLLLDTKGELVASVLLLWYDILKNPIANGSITFKWPKGLRQRQIAVTVVICSTIAILMVSDHVPILGVTIAITITRNPIASGSISLCLAKRPPIRSLHTFMTHQLAVYNMVAV